MELVKNEPVYVRFWYLSHMRAENAQASLRSLILASTARPHMERMYGKTYVKRPLSKRPQVWFSRPIIA